MNNSDIYLGIDWGSKRIGLALGSLENKLALPFKTVANLQELLAVIVAEEVEVIVLGVPRKMNGDSFLSTEFNKFKKDLEKFAKVEIKLQDERLSSKAADALVGGKKDKAGRDEVAASIILQAYFDSLEHDRG